MITPQDRVWCIAQADSAAQQNFEQEDTSSPMATCPARQAEVFIVPTRYALAELGAEHHCFKPAAASQSHPMALRRLRAGYLYLWHHEGPLKRFAVAADGLLQEQELDADPAPLITGSLAGFALNKNHDAWLLYCEIPLSDTSLQRLTDTSTERDAVMQRIRLSEVAHNLEATHCPALERAAQLVAELMPEVRDQALAHDYGQNSDTYRQEVSSLGQQMMDEPNAERIRAYVHTRTWLSELEQAAARHPQAIKQPPGEWSAQPWDVAATEAWLSQARRQAGALHGVFACLDDDLGILRDLNREQERLEASHEAWVADNNLRQSVASFIRSLISEDGGEVANLLSYRYRDQNIPLTAEEGETILDSQRQLAPLFKEESRINQERGRRYSHSEADARLAQVHSHIAAITAPVRTFIPAHLYTEVEHLVREYRAEKLANLDDGRASAKVAEYIDLPRMNAWLDQEAPEHYRQVNERHAALYADRGVFLPRHVAGTWFVEPNQPDHQQWLDELGKACLSAQCSREQGAEQFANYVRASTDGVFRLIFQAWSPSLEAAVNNTNRFNELITALSLNNLAQTRTALAATLDESALRAIGRLASDIDGAWATTVARLGGALIRLKSGTQLTSHWAGLLLVSRLGQDSRLVRTVERGAEVWRLVGSKADALNQWTSKTAQMIRTGRAAGIMQSSVLKNSGGILPLVALLLNALNAGTYLSQASVLEGEDERRQAERLSATLFAAAALTAVVQSWMIRGKGIQELTAKLPLMRSFTAPTLTLFGGIVGGLSAEAAFAEYRSLKKQIENAQGNIDPWLEIRHFAVTGQMAVYGAQALLGLSLTGMRLADKIDTPTAIRHFRLGMGPLNLLLLGLGGVYLYAWSRQSTPLQNYLAGCCWSRGRAYKQESIAPTTQVAEFEQLLMLVYQPQLRMQITEARIPTHVGDTLTQNAINSLTIDLPGADPDTVQAELTLVGNSTPTSARIFGGGTQGIPTDQGGAWLAGSRCTWIPAGEGQGLRLSGSFSRPLTRLSVRLRYHSPVALLAGMENVIGGPRGLAYTLGPDGLLGEGQVIALRAGDPTPELDRATPHRLDPDYLQPKDSA